MKIMLMRAFIENCKSISQLSQPGARNWQHCDSEKQTYVTVKTLLLLQFLRQRLDFFPIDQLLNYKGASRSEIFDFLRPGPPLKKFNFFPNLVSVGFSIKFQILEIKKNLGAVFILVAFSFTGSCEARYSSTLCREVNGPPFDLRNSSCFRTLASIFMLDCCFLVNFSPAIISCLLLHLSLISSTARDTFLYSRKLSPMFFLNFFVPQIINYLLVA